MSPPMKTVSLKLPEELDRALTALARRRQSSRSALLREAIEAMTRPERSTVGELASDLAGSLSGPKDLSSSPRHTSGYGG